MGAPTWHCSLGIAYSRKARELWCRDSPLRSSMGNLLRSWRLIVLNSDTHCNAKMGSRSKSNMTMYVVDVTVAIKFPGLLCISPWVRRPFVQMKAAEAAQH